MKSTRWRRTRAWLALLLLCFAVVAFFVFAWNHLAAAPVRKRVTLSDVDAARVAKPSTNTADRSGTGRDQADAELSADRAPPQRDSATPARDGVGPRSAGDRKKELPWLHPRQCAEVGAASLATRAGYLSTFVPVSAWTTTLYVHPDVPRDAVAIVARALPTVHGVVTKRLNLSATPPLVYLYPSVAALREMGCIAAPAVAFFDGAIHLAVSQPDPHDKYWQHHPDPVHGWLEHELTASLRHEYTHHVLMSNGVVGPFWLQEGAAMKLGGDAVGGSWQLWREANVPVAQMITGIPAGSPPGVVVGYYATAGAMLEFLDRLCLATPDCDLGELVRALTSERAKPETLFDWAISSRGSDLVRTSRLPLWDDYVEHGNFSPNTLTALLGRSRHDRP